MNFSMSLSYSYTKSSDLIRDSFIDVFEIVLDQSISIELLQYFTRNGATYPMTVSQNGSEDFLAPALEKL